MLFQVNIDDNRVISNGTAKDKKKKNGQKYYGSGLLKKLHSFPCRTW